MYTECPNCNTLFKISSVQLKSAGGKVRCGRCNEVFNAIASLTEELPDGISVMTEEARQASSTLDLGKATSKPVTSFENVTIPGMEPDASEKIQPTEHEFSFDFDDSDSMAKKPGKEPSPFDDLDLGGESAAPTAAKDNLEDFEKSLADGDNHYDEPDWDKEKIPEDSHFDALNEDFRMAPADENDRGARAARKSEDVEKENFYRGLEDDPLAAVQSEFDKDFNAADSYVLEELDSPKLRNFGWLVTLGWATLIVVLLVLLVGNFAYFKREDLAKYPALRPALEQMCEIVKKFAACDVPEPKELSAIELIKRDVRSHPTTKGALLISATIVNNAKFAQPFPLMEISFSDVNQKLIARRTFKPREYLAKEVDVSGLLAPVVPVRVMLEIADPGKDAVNFEFNFK